MQYRKAKVFISLLLIWAGLFSICGFASSVTPLPADQAFIFSASFSHSEEVLAQWQIAPGYYLYQQKLQISLSPGANARITYPQGEMRLIMHAAAMKPTRAISVCQCCCRRKISNCK